MTVPNPQVLKDDLAFKAGVTKGIANMSGNAVTQAMVAVDLTVGRRLDLGGRRLSGALNVAYTITVPHTAGAGGVTAQAVASQIKTAIVSTTPAQLTAKIIKALTDQGQGALANGVTVDTKSEPTATVVGTYETTDAFGHPRTITAVRAAVLAAAAALGMRSCGP